MKTYTMYFEFYGRKMKTKVVAESVGEAKSLVLSKVKFLKVEDTEDAMLREFGDLFKDTPFEDLLK
jgi:hypothetical protein